MKSETKGHSTGVTNLPPEQEAIRAKCFHPTGTFAEFTEEEIEQSIPERFEKIVRLYPHGLAVKTKNHSLTYEALNQAANRIAGSWTCYMAAYFPFALRPYRESSRW